MHRQCCPSNHISQDKNTHYVENYMYFLYPQVTMHLWLSEELLSPNFLLPSSTIHYSYSLERNVQVFHRQKNTKLHKCNLCSCDFVK